MTGINGSQLKSNPLLILLVLGFIAVLVVRLIFCFSYLPETGGSSVNTLFGIIRMLNDRALYTNPEMPPYPVILYMPLHYYVVAGVSQLFGVGQSVHAVSVLNRLFCLAFSLLLFIPIRRMLRNIFFITNRRLNWAVCLIVFLMIPVVNYDSPGSLGLLAMVFSAYYILCFLNLFEYKYGSELVLAGIFSALSFFTDQIGIFFIVGVLLFLLIYVKDRRATIRYLLSTALACLFLYIIMVGSTTQNWILNTFIGIKILMSGYWLSEIFSRSAYVNINIVLSAGFFVLLALMRDIKVKEKFLYFTVLFNILVNLGSMIVYGTVDNYLVGGLALFVILFAIYMSRQTVWSLKSRLFSGFIILLILLNCYASIDLSYVMNLTAAKNNNADCIIVARHVKRNVKNDEYIFTDFHRENLMNLMIGEKALFPNRDIVNEITYPGKTFRYDDFTQRVKDGKVKYLVSKQGKKPERFLDADFNAYEKESTIRGYDVYIYKESR